MGLTAEAMEAIFAYNWPGNVRELRNAIEYAFVLCPGGYIDREHLPPKVNGFAQRIPTGHRNRAGSWKNERDNLLEVLRQANGNQSEAAKLMGVSRVTIWKRIKKYGINLNTDLAE
jgi:transcriptional regulator of acetoin/glycerol metabolism